MNRSRSLSGVRPTRRRSPSYVKTSSSATLCSIRGPGPNVMRGRPGLSEDAEVVEDQSGLDPGQHPFPIHFQDPIQVLGKIDDDGRVAAPPGEAGTGSPGKDGDAPLPAPFDSSHHILRVLGDHHADRQLPVVGRVSRIDGSRAVVEPDLSTQALPEFGLQGQRTNRHVRSLPDADRHRTRAWYPAMTCGAGGYRSPAA